MKKLVLYGFDEPKSIPVGMIESIDGLQELEIVNCSLPSLRLPSTLKTLNIKYCHSIESLGLPSTLKTIHISPRHSSIGCEPCLMKRRSQVRIPPPLPLRGHVKKKKKRETIGINFCNTLQSLGHWPSLYIKNSQHQCLWLTWESLRLPSILETIDISFCNSLESLLLPSALKTIHIGVCHSLRSLLDSNSCLQKLSIIYCDSLEVEVEGRFPSTLKTLEVYNFRTLELPAHVHYSSLETLLLSHCWNLDSFPLYLFPNLYQLTLWDCYSLKSLSVPENYEHDWVFSSCS